MDPETLTKLFTPDFIERRETASPFNIPDEIVQCSPFQYQSHPAAFESKKAEG